MRPPDAAEMACIKDPVKLRTLEVQMPNIEAPAQAFRIKDLQSNKPGVNSAADIAIKLAPDPGKALRSITIEMYGSNSDLLFKTSGYKPCPPGTPHPLYVLSKNAVAQAYKSFQSAATLVVRPEYEGLKPYPKIRVVRRNGP